MKIRTKLRKIGNSYGVLIPKDVITNYQLGEEIELDVITKQGKLEDLGYNKEMPVITPKLKFNSKKGIYER